MPSTAPLPTLDELVQAAGDGLRGRADRYADTVSGSLWNHLGGPVAVLLSREADRDRDLFRDIYFDSASSDALTRAVQQRWGIARILDSKGQGACQFARSSAAAGAGSLLAGTRIQVPGDPPLVYEIAQDTAAGATDVQLPVPIQAMRVGTGVAVSAAGLQLLDAVYDPLWQPKQLSCSDGTVFEEAKAYLSRARAARRAQRTGYLARLTQVCQAQGAGYVIPIPSSYGLAQGDFAGDLGMNAIYVADANFQSPPGLVRACTLALETCRVLGNDLWVGGVAQTPLSVVATVALVRPPGDLDLVPIERAILQALLAFFNATATYFYKRGQLSALMRAASPNVQSVALTAPTADALLAANSLPASLPRYTLAARDVGLTFVGPA